MKIFDPKRHLPLGWDWEALRTNLLWGHGFSTLSILAYLKRYTDAREALYAYVEQPDRTLVRQLVPTRTIAPFAELITGFPYLGMGCFLVLMAVLVWRYYAFHTQGSMAVYTMRRLPNRWEYHRRCWMQPLLSALAELLLFAALTGLCWLLWYFATPSPCRPF